MPASNDHTPGSNTIGAERDPVRRIAPGDRWLVVVAHPDDETFGCGSLIADAARQGAVVTVVCATRGEAGERTPDIDADADLGDVRTAELYRAAAALGAAHVELLDYLDSGFDDEPPQGSLCAAALDEVTNTIAAIVAATAPTVVAVLDASDGHRDHQRIRDCSHEAIARLPPCDTTLVEVALPNHLMCRWLDEMRSVQPDAAYHAIDPALFGTPDDVITDVLDHTAVLDTRVQAIALHRSQRSPYADLSPELRRAFLSSTSLIRVRSAKGKPSAWENSARSEGFEPPTF